VSDGPEEIDSKVLLQQGDELLRASRRLLDQLDEVVDLRDDADVDEDDA
jgi:hypothetical protein